MGTGGLGDLWRLSCSNRYLISSVMGTTGGLCRRSIGNGFRRSGCYTSKETQGKDT